MKRIETLRAEVFDAILRAAQETKMQPACLRCEVENQDGETVIRVKTQRGTFEVFRVYVTQEL